MICNSEFKRITRTHLCKHDISVLDYQTLYPDAEMISKELRVQYGKFFRENNPMKVEDIKNMIRATLIGREVSAETRQKQSKAAIGVKRQPHTAETKRKISASNKATNAANREAGIHRPLYNMSIEARQRASERMKGNTIGLIGHKNKGMKLNLSDEQRKNRSKKRVEYLANNKNIKASTSIELKFMKFLTDNNIEYIHQYPVHTDNGSWLYDFYIASMQLFVELDGEFWHSTKQSIRRDKIKNKIAKSVNIVVARISSDDMKFDIIFDDIDTIWNANYNLISIREMKYE